MTENNKPPQENKEQPILVLIEQLKSGNTDPETVTKELRQECIELLMAEGYSISAMAQIFKKCERTVRRDLEDIRARNALTPDIDLAKKIIGELVMFMRTHRGHLMRLARLKDASVAERVQAEYLAARVGLELISKLQTLGFLPLKPQEIIADFSHHISTDDEKSFGELRLQVDEIEEISRAFGELPQETKEELKKLKQKIEKAEIETALTKISETQKKGVKNEDPRT